jgi:hypothetical protein
MQILEIPKPTARAKFLGRQAGRYSAVEGDTFEERAIGNRKNDPIPNMCESDSLSALRGAADRAMGHALKPGCSSAKPW